MQRFTLCLMLLSALAPGASWSAAIERLVMPGPVIKGHAEIENECGNCHAPFSQQTQRSLCLDCHEQIAADLDAGLGFHGRHPDASTKDCKGCHTEHIGRDGEILGLTRETFDHDFTDMPLEGRHGPAACAGCHREGVAFRDAPGACVDCHGEEDPHAGSLGESCGDCHSPAAWRETRFDHDDTRFPLLGKHADTSCNVCHTTADYKAAQTECVACHGADDVHNGSRGDDCGSCHTSTAWDDAQFDHFAETGYPLRGVHADTSCESCHGESNALPEPPTACVGCHGGNDVHAGRRGTFCGDCHNEDRWALAFDHATESGFPLTGEHATLACDACHATSFTDPVPTTCAGCHEAQDPHADADAACDSCHLTASWADEVRFDHDFTKFPLLGMHRTATCDQCHLTLAFADAGLECVACHRADDFHEATQGEACGQCHTPNGWALWAFDHNLQTDFPLAGSHTDLACEACHLPQKGGKADARCNACHERDDPHDGGFGRDCERCHNTRSFDDVSIFE